MIGETKFEFIKQSKAFISPKMVQLKSKFFNFQKN